MSLAKPLPDNAGIRFEGTKKYGDFDGLNPHGKPNSDVVKPWRNGQDLRGRPSDTWIVDFGAQMTATDAALYEKPFAHVSLCVKPERENVRNESAKRIWWLHERARGALREALLGLPRFIATPRVAKHRFFVFLGATVLPDTRLNVIARADDLGLGILSSRMHEAWSLANASIHGDGEEGGRPTFNAKSCFETFPFPGYPDLQSDIKPHIAHIAHAAQPLNDLRENWLNPTEWTERIPEVIPLGMSASPYPDRIVAKPGFEKELAERTLTKLYNQRPAGLDAAHKTLDTAVAAAYGWADYTADMPDEEILKRLLALNLERARTQ